MLTLLESTTVLTFLESTTVLTLLVSTNVLTLLESTNVFYNHKSVTGVKVHIHLANSFCETDFIFKVFDVIAFSQRG